MQTPAERSLIAHLIAFLRQERPPAGRPRIISIGAGSSTVVESFLREAGLDFTCDRLDTEKSEVTGSFVGESYVASAEDMPMIPDGAYDAAFANYVLEHVHGIGAAARGIKRILKPGGIFVVSTPNPQSPEFKLSRFTPLWFHQLMRGSKEEQRAFETVYAYSTIPELLSIFEEAGFKTVATDYFPATETYLHRFPIIKYVSRLYDSFVVKTGIKALHGNVCVAFLN